jgi:hypothetical protein
MRGQIGGTVIGTVSLLFATSCLSLDEESGLMASETSPESAPKSAPTSAIDSAGSPAGLDLERPSDIERASDAEFASQEPDWTLDACFWSGWQCGVTSCPYGYYVHGIDFNASQSEGCWGAGNNYDEPFRRLECCGAPYANHAGCYWTGWGCGDMQCAPGYYTAGVNFNASQSEGCWGAGNDYDEPTRQLWCCNSHSSPHGCYWTGWGCGSIQCAPGHYAAGVDFNIYQSEGCFGAGNDYDEPFRQVMCCAP